MIGYIKDYYTYETKDVFEISEYSVNLSYDFTGISTVITTKKVDANVHDWVLCYNPGSNNPVLKGAFDSVSEADGERYEIAVLQPQTIFDRSVYFTSIYYSSTPNAAETDLAYFINNNWGSSATDPQMKLSYIATSVSTTTQLTNKLEAYNGLINVMEAMLQAYLEATIVSRYTFQASTLTIELKNIADDSPLKISALYPDVVSYTEDKNENAIVKLEAQWKVTDEYDFYGAYGHLTFYLLSDGTISTNASASNRVIDGRTEASVIDAASVSELTSKAAQIFADNAYEHKITFNVLLGNLYELSDFEVGKPAQVYMNGTTYNTYISSIEFSSESNIVTVIFGDLATTLTDKLRAQI